MCDASVGGEERRAEASREFDVCRVVSGESELSSAIERSAERAHRCRIDIDGELRSNRSAASTATPSIRPQRSATRRIFSISNEKIAGTTHHLD